MNEPEILIFMSDLHTASIAAFRGDPVDLVNANVWKVPESLRFAPAEMVKRSPK
jgi:hypothetical protein